MRILYGVQGTGNGHLTRARVLAPALAARGVEVTWLFSGRSREQFGDMTPFGAWEWRRGLTFVHKDGAVDNLATWRANSWNMLTEEIRGLDVRGYDLVVSDFEPVTAWAARRAGIRSIGISHQAAFAHPIPRTGVDPVQAAVFRWFAPVDVAVGVHWDRFGLPLVPPVVDPPRDHAPEEGRVLVYLPFEDLDGVVALLRQVPAARFVCFHPAGPATPTHPAPNVEVHALSRTAFPEALARCGSVLCNAGFELPSEAIALGRRLLVKPLRGQFEQATNGHTLALLKKGACVETLTPVNIARWLATPRPAPSPWPDVASVLADWLADGASEPVALMAERAWRGDEDTARAA